MLPLGINHPYRPDTGVHFWCHFRCGLLSLERVGCDTTDMATHIWLGADVDYYFHIFMFVFLGKYYFYFCAT